MAQQSVIPGVTPPPAPKATTEIITAAVLDYIKRHNFMWARHDQQGAAEQIALYWNATMDGYELARQLEDWAGWLVDLSVAEDLDSIGSAVRERVSALRKEWAEQWNIQPPFAIGTRLTRGVITAIYEHEAATYEVKEDSPRFPGSSLLVKFEDAVVAKQEVSA